jgi:hypothetical protein
LDPSLKQYWQNKGATLQKLHREEEAKAIFAKAKGLPTTHIPSGHGIIMVLPDGKEAMKQFDPLSRTYNIA